MKQQTFSSQRSFEKYGRKSRRELFLDEMDLIVPWAELEALVEPHYPKAGNGRRPVGLSIMLQNKRTPSKNHRTMAVPQAAAGPKPRPFPDRVISEPCAELP